MHHSDDPYFYGRNLGIPVIWDRLFGTFADPRLAAGIERFGVCDAPTNTGRPHVEAWRDLMQWRRAIWRLVQLLRPRRKLAGATDAPPRQRNPAGSAASIARRFLAWNNLR